MKKAKLFSLKYLFYDFTKITAAIPGLIAFRPKWIYTSEKAKKFIRGGALVISNHNSFFDPIYLQFAIWYRRHRCVAKADMFTGFGGTMLKLFRCLPIDRDNMNLTSFKEIIKSLKEGELVSMFPEGHINVSEKDVDDFKSGMVLIAMQAGVPIVPVYIGQRKSVFNRMKYIIGEPIEVKKGLKMTEMNEITRELQRREEEMKSLSEK